MKLTDFKTTRRGKDTRLVAGISDQTGARDYEIRIAGPAAAVKRVFAKSDFSITIDPNRSVQNAEKEFAKYTQAQTQQFAELAQIENIRELDLFKRPVRQPDREKSIFVSLQRVRGEGTYWIWAFQYYLSTGWSIFLYPPPVAILAATVYPAAGDQDIFLNSVFGPSLGSSRRGGTSPDTVFYPGPPPGFLRIRIFGFAAGWGSFFMAAI